MNLIEEAARRLRQLDQAGVTLPAQAGPVVERTAMAAVRKVEPAATPAAVRSRRIDLGRLQAAGFVTPEVQTSKLMHEFRVIKRPLIQHALGKTATGTAHRNLIMVTSALPGEGKTFVALNLAISMAMEVDCRVLLVDADVISPSVPRVLGLEPAKGLMDLLTDKTARLGDVLLGTNVERLTLLLAGTSHSSASELLASEAMARLLDEISNRYPDRIIVFDSPPLLATTESRVLATHMGQIVVVVEAERTTQSTLESALSTVENCPMVLTMLNKAAQSDAGSYYGAYGYGR